MNRPIVNVDELVFERWDKNFPNTAPPPPTYDAKRADVGKRIGARKLGYNVTRIEPGKRAFPRHNHRVNEEMFLILAGTGELRVGDERWPVRKGDIVACPPGGPETAHQLANTSTSEPLDVLSVSTFESADIVEYPDSGKVGYGALTPGLDGKPQRFGGLSRANQPVDYWDGE